MKDIEILDYDQLPLRVKETSDGEMAKNHHSRCGGRCAVFYAEDRRYQVVCEHCGALVAFRTTDHDRAIKIWNDMPDALEGKYGR